MGHGARDGRVGLLAVAGRGVGEAQRVEWDVGGVPPGGVPLPMLDLEPSAVQEVGAF